MKSLYLISIVGLMTYSMGAAADSKVSSSKAAKAREVVFENQLVEGKKTWLPSTVKAQDGEHLTFRLVNKLGAAHGFYIKGYTEPVIVTGNSTKILPEVVAKKGTYAVKCHLHPAHVGAQIIVK
jgi:hypothetical protein